MLGMIRKNQKTILIKVVFWAIIGAFVGTIFLVWGKGSNQGGQNPSVAVSVNQTKISFDEYQTTYDNLFQRYQSIFRGKFTPAMQKRLNLKKQALNSVIQEALLVQEADREGLTVSHQDLVDSIARIPAFQVNGVFNKSRYLRVLAYQRMTADDFEAAQKHRLLVQKVVNKIQQGVSVTDRDVKEAYRKQNEKVDLRYIQVAPALFESKVPMNAKALQSFFADHQEEFRVPETLSLNYINFDPARYEKDVTFEKGELEKYYRQHLDSFSFPKEVKAAHILIKVPQNAGKATVAKKQELAEKILKEARSGKNFGKLARKYSDDTGTAAEGGELGYFARGTMVPAFAKAAFSLKIGQLSNLVRTPFGFHIIKVEAIRDAGVKPLSAVVDQIKAQVRKEDARQIAYEKAMNAYHAITQSGDLQKAAKDNDLKVQTTALFSRQGPVDGLGDATDVITSAFSLRAGELAHPVNLPQGVILFKVKDRKESHIPELSEVRSQVKGAYLQEKSKDLAKQAAETIRKALEKGASLSSEARKYGLKVSETGLFTRASGASVIPAGNSEELAKAAFTLTRKNPVPSQVFPIGGNFVVVKLKAREEANMKTLDAAKSKGLKAELLYRKQEEALDKKIEELRKQAKIVISPTLQNSLERG